MPMFKALKVCPDAVVIRPDMNKYRRIGYNIREIMREVTPQVEPISIDEPEAPKKKKKRRRAKKSSPDLPAKNYKNIDSRSLR